MKSKKNIYFNDITLEFLETKDNYSEYIQNLILKDMNDKSSLLKMQEELKEEKKSIQIRLTEIESELMSIDQEIERIDHMFNNRPEEYDYVVNTLLNLRGGVSQKDLQYQAKVLDVEVALLKRWLFDDGVYDQLFLK